MGLYVREDILIIDEGCPCHVDDLGIFFHEGKGFFIDDAFSFLRFRKGEDQDVCLRKDFFQIFHGKSAVQQV